MATGTDTLKTRRTLEVDGKSSTTQHRSIGGRRACGRAETAFSLKVLLENYSATKTGGPSPPPMSKRCWPGPGPESTGDSFRPARVLMQDTPVCGTVVDLAAMQDAMNAMGGIRKINPLSPVDLVIDHSLMVDYAGGADSFRKNVRLSSSGTGGVRVLALGREAFRNFRVVPPGAGICHQVNLSTSPRRSGRRTRAARRSPIPTAVGTDSHRPWLTASPFSAGRGRHRGISMLGQPISCCAEVIGSG